MAVICSICGKERSFWFRKKFQKFNGRWYCLSCAEKVKREDFCKKIKPYIEEGLVKEIYYNQMYSICNLANQTYGVFVYGLESFCALLVCAKEIDYIALEAGNLSRFINSMDRDVLVKRCIEFSDKTFDILRKMKKDNDERGPKADIDISVEEYWSKRSGERLE